MKGLLGGLLTLGVEMGVDWLRANKPLRTWIAKRRAAKGKGPLLPKEQADALADDAFKRAEELSKSIP